MKLWFSKDNSESTIHTPAAPQTPPPLRQPAPPPPSPPSPPPAAPEPPPAPAAPLQQPVNQRELYRSLMDALYDAVLLVDEKGHVVDSNARVEPTFGYSPSEMWDMSIQQLVKGFGQHVLVQLAEPLHEHRPVIIDGRGVRKDGSLFTAEITVGRVKLGRSESILLAIRDVGKRLASTQAKMRAQILAELKSDSPAPPPAPTKVVRLARKPSA